MGRRTRQNSTFLDQLSVKRLFHCRLRNADRWEQTREQQDRRVRRREHVRQNGGREYLEARHRRSSTEAIPSAAARLEPLAQNLEPACEQVNSRVDAGD